MRSCSFSFLQGLRITDIQDLIFFTLFISTCEDTVAVVKKFRGSHTLPETNELHLKMLGWKMKFPSGMANFQGQAVSFREGITSGFQRGSKWSKTTSWSRSIQGIQGCRAFAALRFTGLIKVVSCTCLPPPGSIVFRSKFSIK